MTKTKPLSKTQARVAELKGARLADVLRAAADLLERKVDGGFQGFKSNGWAVRIGNRSFAHRKLIAHTIWHATKRKSGKGVVRTKEDFEGSGAEYKGLLQDRFGLTIEEFD